VAARVPFRITVTFGLHPCPVVGLPFPGGGAATAAEAARQTAARAARRTFVFT
jgi:hypothetical protein